MRWVCVVFEVPGTMSNILQPEIIKSNRGPIFVFYGKWLSTYEDILQKNAVVGIAADFRGNDYEADFSFLKKHAYLQYFSSGVAFPICSEALYHLKNLRFIRLLATRGMKFDFTRFGKLEVVEIPWVEGMNSIFECSSLRRLTLQGCRLKNSSIFQSLRCLEALDLRDAGLVEIDAFAKLSKLRKLRLLLLPRLASFAPLGTCDLLEVLHLGKCGKADDLDHIKYLKQLKYLILATGKSVKSLDFIKPLINLKLFNFDCNVEDGDLSSLETLPNLAKTVFRRQRHYKSTFQEVQKYLAVAGRRMSADEYLYGTEFGFGLDDWVVKEE